MTKSEAIRNELKKNGSPSVVAKRLKAKGINCTAQYVSSIKAADKRRQESKSPRRGPGRPPRSGVAVSLHTNDVDVALATRLVLSCGIEKARFMIESAHTVITTVNSSSKAS